MCNGKFLILRFYLGVNRLEHMWVVVSQKHLSIHWQLYGREEEALRSWRIK